MVKDLQKTNKQKHVMNEAPDWGFLVIDDEPGKMPQVINVDRVRAMNELLIKLGQLLQETPRSVSITCMARDDEDGDLTDV